MADRLEAWGSRRFNSWLLLLNPAGSNGSARMPASTATSSVSEARFLGVRERLVHALDAAYTHLLQLYVQPEAHWQRLRY
jgi:hypothetical protein